MCQLLGYSLNTIWGNWLIIKKTSRADLREGFCTGNLRKVGGWSCERWNSTCWHGVWNRAVGAYVARQVLILNRQLLNQAPGYGISGVNPLNLTNLVIQLPVRLLSQETAQPVYNTWILIPYPGNLRKKISLSPVSRIYSIVSRPEEKFIFV